MDLADQIAHIALDSPASAVTVGDAIVTAAGALAAMPHQGRAGRIAGTRELIVPHTPHIIVYRAAAERITILRVLHGAQQWPQRRR